MTPERTLTVALPIDAIEAVVDARIAERLAQLEVEASPWMTIDAAADYLGWPKARLYKLTSTRAIPHRKHEGRVLFRRDELDRWLDGFQEGPRV